MSSKKQEQDRRRELPFILKKISNNANLHYFQCVTHKNCTYVEMVRRGESGHGDQRIIFTKEDATHTTEFAPVSNGKYGINPRWAHIVDLLVDSGRTPAEIRTQLVLKANNAKDQDEAISAFNNQTDTISEKKQESEQIYDVEIGKQC